MRVRPVDNRPQVNNLPTTLLLHSLRRAADGSMTLLYGLRPGYVMKRTAIAAGRLRRLPGTADGRTTLLSYNCVDHRYFDTLALRVEGRAMERFPFRIAAGLRARSADWLCC